MNSGISAKYPSSPLLLATSPNSIHIHTHPNNSSSPPSANINISPRLSSRDSHTAPPELPSTSSISLLSLSLTNMAMGDSQDLRGDRSQLQQQQVQVQQMPQNQQQSISTPERRTVSITQSIPLSSSTNRKTVEAMQQLRSGASPPNPQISGESLQPNAQFSIPIPGPGLGLAPDSPTLYPTTPGGEPMTPMALDGDKLMRDKMFNK